MAVVVIVQSTRFSNIVMINTTNIPWFLNSPASQTSILAATQTLTAAISYNKQLDEEEKSTRSIKFIAEGGGGSGGVEQNN